MIWILPFALLFYKLRIGQLSEVAVLAILAGITAFYAWQTHRLARVAEKQSSEFFLRRDLEFNEKRLHIFYNKYIHHLDLLEKEFGDISLNKFDERLDDINYEIFFPYTYMVNPKTETNIHGYKVLVKEMAMKELNKEGSPEDRRNIFRFLKILRKKLHDEREKIESYINANYSFPEKGGT